MYFDRSTKRAEHYIEPFSLKALAISKGQTSQISEVTPILFEDEQEVRLKKVYKEILDEFKSKSKYKQYFSVWIVVGSAWSIPEEQYYYMIRNRFAVFAWVTDDQIKKAGVQKQIVEGPTSYYRKPRFNKREPSWVSNQQTLDSSPRARVLADMCDINLHDRLKRQRR
jgi:uncharacterized protein (DUF2461 family)